MCVPPFNRAAIKRSRKVRFFRVRQQYHCVWSLCTIWIYLYFICYYIYNFFHNDLSTKIDRKTIGNQSARCTFVHSTFSVCKKTCCGIRLIEINIFYVRLKNRVMYYRDLTRARVSSIIVLFIEANENIILL